MTFNKSISEKFSKPMEFSPMVEEEVNYAHHLSNIQRDYWNRQWEKWKAKEVTDQFMGKLVQNYQRHCDQEEQRLRMDEIPIKPTKRGSKFS